MTTLEGVTPFPLEYVERYRALGYWENRSMASFFAALCARFPEHIAIVAGSEQITYGELAQRAERLEVVEDFPKSKFGKVSKRDLVLLIAARLEEERTPA